VEETLTGRKLLDGRTEFLIQAAATGSFEQVHSIFSHSRLLALHCTRRLSEGVGGGPIVKAGVSRPMLLRHLEKMGRFLAGHGSLSIDYFFDGRTGQPSYIDANPRITEPMNAVTNGINLADLQVQLALDRDIRPLPPAHTTRKSHSTVQAVMGGAGRRHSRLDVLRELVLVLFRKGIYENSIEGVTPVLQDFPSILSLVFVLMKILFNPGVGQHLAEQTIANYSLGQAIPRLSGMQRTENAAP